jgi:hypothetical protein
MYRGAPEVFSTSKAGKSPYGLYCVDVTLNPSKSLAYMKRKHYTNGKYQ